MNILLLTQVLPYPPDSGPKVKTYNLIKYLTRHHEVTLVSFVRGNQTDHIRHLKKYCRAVHTVPMARSLFRDAWYMARSFMTGTPFLILRDDSAAMRNVVDTVCLDNPYDAVHADQLNMAQYAQRAPARLRVLDEHNALWLLYQRLWETMPFGIRKCLLKRDWQLLKRYEGRTCSDFDLVLAVSPEDKAAIEETTGHPVPIRVIPIAIDTEESPALARNPGPCILHMGTMYWPPNIDAVRWFANRVYPLIRRQRPDVQFDVVGPRPPAEISALGAKGQGINVTGYVEDPEPYMKRSAVLVVPLLAGGGMRVKILNAMAAGIPVVSTTLGYEGIELQPGRDILVADTPESFAAQVLRVLNEPLLAEELSTNARNLVETKYHYATALRPLDHIYPPGPEVDNTRRGNTPYPVLDASPPERKGSSNATSIPKIPARTSCLQRCLRSTNTQSRN